MATEIQVRGATIPVRSLPVTRHLLKQCRVFKGTPPLPFCEVADDHMGRTKVLPEYAIGWFRGSVLGDEFSDFVMFVKDGDAVLGKMGRDLGRWSLPKEVKQLYIG